MRRPTRYLPNGREIWFEKGLIGYWPCHWKGWMALAVATVLAVSAMAALPFLLPRSWLFEMDARAFLPLAPFAAILLWLSHRHSAPRGTTPPRTGNEAESPEGPTP